MGRLTRRQFVRSAGAAGALLAARPLRGLAATPLGGFAPIGASRKSRLFPSGRFLVHSDLHNHSVISGDAVGVTEDAFPMMRAAGIDAAALTEHATMGKGLHGEFTCPSGGCKGVIGMNEDEWQALLPLADEHTVDHEFIAMRAFEWTTGTIGHLNVWFSENWIDALTVGGITDLKGAQHLDEVTPLPPELVDQFAVFPTTAVIEGFYRWLQQPPDFPVLGGGSDAIASFNHPNEYGDFENYRFVPELVDQIVSAEAINMGRDFFSWGVKDGLRYPLNALLNAGWRVGLNGVSDEHGDTYGLEGRGRGGLWVTELTHDGVREALTARRTFATIDAGLRVDAAANGVPMGSVLPHTRGPVHIELDIDRGPSWYRKPLVVQVIRPGEEAPQLALAVEFEVPPPGRPVLSLTLDVDIEDGDWMFLRITDPERPPTEQDVAPFRAGGAAIAYASPWFLEPGSAPPSPTPTASTTGSPTPGTTGSPSPTPSGSGSPTVAPTGGTTGTAGSGGTGATGTSGGPTPSTGGGIAGGAALIAAAAALRRRGASGDR